MQPHYQRAIQRLCLGPLNDQAGRIIAEGRYGLLYRIGDDDYLIILTAETREGIEQLFEAAMRKLHVPFDKLDICHRENNVVRMVSFSVEV
jgi:hypothetical protein